MTALQSYLFAWLFFLGLSLGALANLMVHTLTHGRWGQPLRPPLIAAARLLWIVALLYLPLAFGVRELYPWAMQGAGERPAVWVNEPFFLVRSALYLLVWCALSFAWLRAERRSLESARRVSAAGLLVYAVTISLAGFDWIVTLDQHWRSSGFGLVLGLGQMLAGAAFGVAVAARSAPFVPNEALRFRFHDLGNILLTYVLFWAYLAFTQFLIIWAEDLPNEILWYLPRMQTSWMWLGIFLVIFHFFVPLVILLSRAGKRSTVFLGWLAAALLLAHLGDTYWLVIPNFRRDGIDVAWTDFAAFVAIGAVWSIGWVWYSAHRALPAALETRADG
jgi:hypothetical protein